MIAYRITSLACVFLLNVQLCYGDTTTTSNPDTTTVSTGTTGSTTTISGDGGLCRPGVPIDQGDRANNLDVLEQEFKPPGDESFQRPVDIVFIIDRSASIGTAGIKETKKLINTLLSRLAELRYILVHPLFTRVAIVSFDESARPELDGLSDSNQAIDACVVNEFVEALGDNSQGDSQIGPALSRVHELFSASKSDPTRANASRILWLFNDGECINEGCKPYSFAGKSIHEWLSSLRTELKVTVFVTGVGQWLNDLTKINRVRDLATDHRYFACGPTWEDVLPDLTAAQRGEANEPLYSEIPQRYKDRCGNDTCPQGQECACNVISRTYDCTNATIIGEPTTTPTTTTTTTQSAPSAPNTTPYPEWVLPVAYGASAGVGLLLLILVIALPCLAVRRKKIREEEDKFLNSQPIYGGPPLPPPPIIRARRPGLEGADEDNIYANTIGNINQPVDQSNRADQDYAFMEYPQDYVNDEVQLDNDMQGWPGEMSWLKQSKNLTHLGVRSIPKKRWAITAGAPFTEKDFREMENIMRNPKLDDRKMKIAGKTYDIDPEHLSRGQIHAKRFIHRGLHEVVWVSKVYDYVIVGIANDSQDEECVRAVQQLHKHLKTIIMQDRGSYIQGALPEEDIYSMVLPNYGSDNDGYRMR